MSQSKTCTEIKVGRGEIHKVSEVGYLSQFSAVISFFQGVNEMIQHKSIFHPVHFLIIHLIDYVCKSKIGINGTSKQSYSSPTCHIRTLQEQYTTKQSQNPTIYQSVRYNIVTMEYVGKKTLIVLCTLTYQKKIHPGKLLKPMS